jgi:hypothetical protein
MWMVVRICSRRWFAWLAAIALLFAALAPAVSQAVATSRGADAGLTPICTHAGLKWVDAATGEVRDAPADVDVGNHLERCPFCLTTSPALPGSAAEVRFAVPELPAESPYLFDHAPRTLFVWAHAPSRAPPSRV